LKIGGIDRAVIVADYFARMADFPREVGRQIAGLKEEMAALLDSPEVLTGPFGVNAILAAISYWKSSEGKHEECDRLMREIAEKIVSEYAFSNGDFRSPAFLPSLLEICQSLELFVQNEISEEKVGGLRKTIADGCEDVRLQLLLFGQPSDSAVMKLLGKVIEAAHA
jgi:hypothetical protein